MSSKTSSKKRPKRQPTFVTEYAPEYWAGYLVNHDPHSLEPQERAACDAWLADIGYKLSACVGQDADAEGDVEVEFMQFDGLLTGCIPYIFAV